MSRFLAAKKLRGSLTICVISIGMIFNGVHSYAEVGAESFEDRVIDAILENPEVVLLAMEKLRHLEAAAARDAQAAQIAEKRDALFPDPDIVLVEFFDYRCGYCGQNAEILAQMDQEDLKKVRLLELPMLGPASDEIARVALGVRNTYGEEAYRSFHFAVFNARGVVDGNSALRLVAEIGLSRNAVESAAADAGVDQELLENRRLAESLGVSGIPAFVTDSALVEGVQDRDMIMAMISGDAP